MYHIHCQEDNSWRAIFVQVVKTTKVNLGYRKKFGKFLYLKFKLKSLLLNA